MPEPPKSSSGPPWRAKREAGPWEAAGLGPPAVRALVRWGGAITVAGVAIAVRAMLGPEFRLTFLMFFPAIALAAWFGGLGPGLLVTLLCTVTAMYFFAPVGSFFVERSEDALALAVFVGIGGLISGLYERVHVARRRAERDALALAQALRARDDFLSVAGHELRTPLTALKLQIDSAQRYLAGAPDGPDGELASRLRPRLYKTSSQVARLERLVDDLLDVSRIIGGNGRLPLVLETVDLAALAREVAERFTDVLAQAGSALTLDLGDGATGSWDRSRLDQVITNLLGNAVKYGRGQPITVRVAATAAGARLVVEDRGIGIAPEAQARIFERFERAVSQRNFGGLGLGLWITRGIVEALGGAIAVESRPGEGARFTVDLPRAAPATPAR